MANDEWRQSTLGDIAKAEYGLVDGPFGSNLPASEYVPSGVPVIRGSNLSLGGLRFNGDAFVYVSETFAQRLARSLCVPGDIVFTKKGTLGQTGIIPASSHFHKFLLSSNQMKLSVDPNKAHPLFVYYFVSSPISQEKIIQDSTVTGVPKTNLAYLRDFPILLPPLEEQNAIAQIVGTLDDKIELNRKMNEMLEAMARALFKSWFVDFDPVRAKAEGRDTGLPEAVAALFPESFEDTPAGKIPAGWSICGLDEIARFLNGLALQKFPPTDGRSLPVIKIAQLRTEDTSGADHASAYLANDYIVEDGDVLFSWSGSLTCVLWAGGRGALNQHLFKVTSSIYPKWFYWLWIRQHLADFQTIAADKATTMGHIQRHHLSEAKVLLPPAPLIAEATKHFAPIVDQIIGLKIEAKSLAATRDALLPKLISGEIRLNQMEERA